MEVEEAVVMTSHLRVDLAQAPGVWLTPGGLRKRGLSVRRKVGLRSSVCVVTSPYILKV